MKYKILLTAMGVVLLFQWSYAEKWRVNNNVGVDADFTSFSEAQVAASEGDTLFFEGSSQAYGEKDTLQKRLCIVGPGYFLDENFDGNDHVLPASLGMLYMDTLASGSKIMGMHFGESLDVLKVDASNVIIERNYIGGTLALAYENGVQDVVISKNYVGNIDTRWTYPGGANVLISGNIVKASVSLNAMSTATIVNNTIGSNLIVYYSLIKNNIIYNLTERDGNHCEYNVCKSVVEISGDGNVFGVDWATLFASEGASTDGAYQLAEDSPAKGAGEGGVDCGAYGGADVYVLSGIPNFPYVADATVPVAGTNVLQISIQGNVSE